MNWQDHLQRWTAAGLIDADTAAEIRAFETSGPDERRVRWPVILAVAFGGVLLTAGLLLFVSAHWDALSPAARIAIVMIALAALHIGGVLSSKFPALATTLHAAGTAGLGGAIALAGQVFHMDEHWPAAILLWAIGAWLGVWLLRDVPQLALAAVLTPAWIVSEAIEYNRPLSYPPVWAIAFLALTAFVYLSAAGVRERSVWRGTLAAVGAIALLPAAIILSFFAAPLQWDTAWLLLLPLPAAYHLRRRDSWPAVGWAIWATLQAVLASERMTVAAHLLAGAGSIALACWGIAELRKERVNLGIAGFIVTVISFYSIYFIDAVNRSLGLIGLGLLFLICGWQLERLRRKLMRQIDQGAQPA